ncbi:MAG: glycogen/starch synthase, partial [Bacteriovoracia bacterium]
DCDVHLFKNQTKHHKVINSAHFSKLPKAAQKSLKHWAQVEESPVVITAAMEFGQIELMGKTYRAKVGGLGVVIQDWITEMPKYLKSRGGKIGFVFPSFEGMPKGKLVTSFDIEIGHGIEKVKLYKIKHKDGGDIFVVDHPVFKKRSIINKERNLYRPEPGKPLLDPNHSEWDEPYFFALYNQSIAKVVKHYKANIYHGHDYHTGLASFYLNPDEVTSAVTIHNGGYPGVFYTKGYGEGNARIAHAKYAYGVPVGDYKANDFFINKVMKIDFDQYMNYFNRDQNFEILPGVTKYLDEKFGFGGIAVSSNYADELGLSTNQIHQKIMKQNGGSGPLAPEKLYIPNNNRFLGNLDGIENGMAGGYRAFKEEGIEAAGKHAAGHPALRAKADKEIGKLPERIPDHVKMQWKQSLNFGKNLETKDGVEQVFRMKRKLKQMALETYFPHLSPSQVQDKMEKPLIGLVARLVEQKNLAVLVDTVDDIVAKGGTVLIGGQAGDDAGRAVVSKLEELMNKYPDNVYHANEFVSGESALLIQAGADVSVFTPKFEPCGLTDIEAAWLGTLVVTRRTGGLDKLGDDVAVLYDWLDSSNHLGEVQALKNTLDDVFDMYYHRPQAFKKRIVKGLKSEFSYTENFSKLELNWQMAAARRAIEHLKQMNSSEFYVELYLKNAYPGLKKNIKRLLSNKHNKTEIENTILNQLD